MGPDAMSNFITTVATIVIAYAAWQTWHVYQHMSEQIEQQIGLTRDLFFESHAPILAVSIKRCGYANTPAEGGLKGTIVIANHGTVAANEVTLNVNFGGFNAPKQISKIAVPPKGKVKLTLFVPMTAERYATGSGTENHFNALIEGSYTGVAGRTYLYKDRQNYDPDLSRFVSFFMNW
jgi:hypothetical protein